MMSRPTARYVARHKARATRHPAARFARRAGAGSLAMSLVTVSSWAFWSVGTAPGGNGAAAAATVGATQPLKVSATGSNVEVSWTQATLSNGAPVTGYVVRRYAAKTLTPATVGAGCTGTVTNTGCTETGVPDGSWVYTVTPSVGTNWRGPMSTYSDEVIVDTTAPTGGSVDATGLGGTGGRYSTSQNLNIAFSPGTDTNGIATTGNALHRAVTSAAMSNGVCGAFGPYSLVTGGNDPVSPKTDAVPTNERCYRYQYVARDTFGNAATYTSPDVKVDTTAPAAPTLQVGEMTAAAYTGGTLWYRPSATQNGFSIKANASDTSGIASYAFPDLGAGWTGTASSPTITRYTWTANPAVPGARPVTATNNAGLTSTAAGFAPTPDGTVPTGTLDYLDGLTTADVISVTTSHSDTQSGVVTRLLQRAVAPMTDTTCGTFGTFTTVVHGTNPRSPREDPVTPGHCYKYQYVLTDAVGNTATVTSAKVAKVVDSSYATTVKTSTGVSGYWRLGDSPQLRDTFTGTAGTPLQNRPADSGASWVKWSSGLNSVLTAQGRLRRSGEGYLSFYTSDAELNRADYTVEADLHVASVIARDGVGLVARFDREATYYYVAGYDVVHGAWQINRVAYSGAARMLLAQTPAILTPGTTYHLAFDVRGSQLRLLVDGAVVASALNADATAIGAAGVLFGNTASVSAAPTDTTGFHLDNLHVSPPMADARGARPGTYSGAPLLRVTGAISGDLDTAATFDGLNDHGWVELPVANGDLSVELWFKAAGGSGTSGNWYDGATLFSGDMANTATDFGISLRGDGKLVGGFGVGTGAVSVVSTASVADRAWHHVVLTRSQSTGAVTLYVDGTSQGTVNGSTSLASGAVSLRFGAPLPGFGTRFVGTLDDISTYDAVLSAETVSAHRLSGTGGAGVGAGGGGGGVAPAPDPSPVQP